MTYEEVLSKAREVLEPKCKVCPECNGVACKGQIPGVGGIGNGKSFMNCREFFKSVDVNMDALHEVYDPDTSVEMFGRKFDVPFFAAPIGGMPFNYTGYMTEAEYASAIVNGCLQAGGLGFTGDGPSEDYFPSTLPVIKEAGGVAVSTIKPWENEKIIRQIKMLEETGAIAFAVDVDSAALINLKLRGKPVYTKSTEELKEIVESTKLPFIVKGVMTAKSALRCVEAGAYGIVVSSHGGRILEDTPCPASMLREIKAAVGDRIKIFVDGGIRSGADVFKCLALGADAVLIGRPYSVAAHGGAAEGVKIYTEKIKAELTDLMMMTDCRSIKDITEEKIR